jgi:hypothetical protein
LLTSFTKIRQLMLTVIFKLCKNCDKLFVENVLECLLEVSYFCMTMQLPTLLEKHVKPLRRWVWKFSNTPPHSPRTLWLPPVWKVERTPVRKTFCLWSRSGKWNKKLA